IPFPPAPHKVRAEGEAVLSLLECGDSFAAFTVWLFWSAAIPSPLLLVCLAFVRRLAAKGKRKSGEGIAALQKSQNTDHLSLPQPVNRVVDDALHPAALLRLE